MFNIEALIWYLFLLDSLIVNTISWCCPKYYGKKFKRYKKHFPMTKGWCSFYLLFVLWVGYALLRLNILPW